MSNNTSTFWLAAQANTRLKKQLPSLQVAPRQDILTLSFQQEKLWRLEQLNSNTSVYNLLHIIRFSGPLNLVALEESLQEIVQRHAILHTAFFSDKGIPCQAIGPNHPVKLPVIDLRQIPLEQREVELQRLAFEEAEHPFNLTQQGLWRLKLVRSRTNCGFKAT
ncbi:condensation domain-containing protein [Trichothermofontia sp.]